MTLKRGRGGAGGGGDRAGRGIRRAGALLLAAQLVGEAHLHLDLLARVGGGQRVGGGGRVGDVRRVRHAVGVHPHPLVGEARGQPVGVHDGARVGGQLLPGLRRAGNRRLARRDVVRRQAQIHRAGHHRGRPVEACRPVACSSRSRSPVAECSRSAAFSVGQWAKVKSPGGPVIAELCSCSNRWNP